MTPRVHAAILGAGGYGASELLRLCATHPAIEVVSITSTSHVGKQVHEVHPHLRGFYDLQVQEEVDVEKLEDAEASILFSALPHGVSSTAIVKLLRRLEDRGSNATVRVVDLSGDLRLKDLETHRRFYSSSPDLPELRARFVYGLPELRRDEMGDARFVANPGCLASASILAAAPLAGERGAGFSGSLVLDAKTGSSGSGNKLKTTTHHPTRHSNFRAYKPLGHQHEPEIKQALGDPLGERLEVSFVAQSMDTTRGIFVTAHMTLADPIDQKTLDEQYSRFYANRPFVRLVDGTPELQNVVGSNFCDIAVACRARQVIAMCAIDNLIKGMAGTAIQNANLMCGLPETTGLWQPSLRPV